MLFTFSFEENCCKRKWGSSANRLSVLAVSEGFTAAKRTSSFLL